MDHPAYRNAYRAGFAVFGVLLIHATVFYKERMVMPDAALYLFSIIQHNRFVCAAPEILPLIGLKLRAPLSALAMLYSLAFPLYYLGCYLLCGLDASQLPDRNRAAAVSHPNQHAYAIPDAIGAQARRCCWCWCCWPALRVA